MDSIRKKQVDATMAMDTIQKEIATWSVGFKKPCKSAGMVAAAGMFITKVQEWKPGSKIWSVAKDQAMSDRLWSLKSVIMGTAAEESESNKVSSLMGRCANAQAMLERP